MACARLVASTGKYCCSCNKIFLTEDDLKEHEHEQKTSAKDFPCSKCCRSFDKVDGLYSHKRSKGHWEPGERDMAQQILGRVFCHDTCGKSFKSKGAFEQHCNHFRKMAGIENVCHGCTKTFPEPKRLEQHQRDTGHKVIPRNPANNYIDKFMKVKNVHVDPSDKKASVEKVKSVLDDVMKEIRKHDGGKMYSADIRKAGSHAVKAKIGKPDEFDTNIPMNVNVKEVQTRGDLPYKYEDKVKPNKDGHSPSNLNVPRNLVDDPSGTLDTGRARVTVDPGMTTANLVYKGDLIAHKAQQDFYRRLCDALKNLDMKDVHVSRNAHGPAITIIIKQPNGHDISVDLTLTLPHKELVTHNGWPRYDTKKAFSPDVIKAVIDTGMHLVPKGNEVWTPSYSKAEKALLISIDKGNGCRRNVLKYLKRLTQMCASGSGNGLPGVSSHILKHSLLWSCEKRNGDNYWHQSNMSGCLVDAMKDLEDHLRSGRLDNYFNTRENILRGKDRAVLNTLADHIKQERMKLIHVQ